MNYSLEGQDAGHGGRRGRRGYAGNQLQKGMQQKDVVTSTERRCRTVNDMSQKLVGYDVTYRLDGKEEVVRMPKEPGATLLVRDGKVVTTEPEAPS